MLTKIELGEKIRAYRLLKGLSQENIASSLGISQTAYAQIERGESDVRLSRISQIADTLDVPVKELLSFGDNGTYVIHKSKNAILYANNGTREEPIELIAELRALRTENDLLRQQIQHLETIIKLIEDKK